MTLIAIELPDDLAQKATAAGLLAPEAVADMLREQLRRRSLERLGEQWARIRRTSWRPRSSKRSSPK